MASTKPAPAEHAIGGRVAEVARHGGPASATPAPADSAVAGPPAEAARRVRPASAKASAYLTIAGPLAEAALKEARELPSGEIERLEAALRPLAGWRTPAVAEHAAGLLKALAALRGLRDGAH